MRTNFLISYVYIYSGYVISIFNNKILVSQCSIKHENKKKQKYVSITKSSNEKYLFEFITASDLSCPLAQNETPNILFVMTKKGGNETKGNSGIYSKLYKYYNISIL